MLRKDKPLRAISALQRIAATDANCIPPIVIVVEIFELVAFMLGKRRKRDPHAFGTRWTRDWGDCIASVHPEM